MKSEEQAAVCVPDHFKGRESDMVRRVSGGKMTLGMNAGSPPDLQHGLGQFI